MEKNKELEPDILRIKSVLNKYLCLCKDMTAKYAQTDKVINSRKNFIISQLKETFFTCWIM